jgi:hypothetical protein
MNTRKYLLFAMPLILAIVLIPAGQANAKMVKTHFTGTEVHFRDVSAGTETYPDKNLYHTRNAVEVFTVQTSDLRVSGEDRVVVNWNFKLVDAPVYVTGKMWGTFTITNADGYWAGNWSGVRDKDGYSYYRFEGKGYGDYKGMKLFMRLQRLTPDPTQPETISGYILEPES